MVEAKIEELAADIKARGLQQRPKGRQHPDKPNYIQLAYGHHRHAAFKQLYVNNPSQFGFIEIEVASIPDQAMPELAIIENAKRGDLTPVEKGRALKAHMENFKIPLKETAQLFNLSESGASNLMRLL